MVYVTAIQLTQDGLGVAVQLDKLYVRQFLLDESTERRIKEFQIEVEQAQIQVADLQKNLMSNVILPFPGRAALTTGGVSV